MTCPRNRDTSDTEHPYFLSIPSRNNNICHLFPQPYPIEKNHILLSQVFDYITLFENCAENSYGF